MKKKRDFLSKYTDSMDDPKRENIFSSMITHYSGIQKIELYSYLKSFIMRFKSPKRHKLLEKSVMKIEK